MKGKTSKFYFVLKISLLAAQMVGLARQK